MSTATLSATRRPRAAVRVWTKHLLCFAFPLLTLSFLATGPHSWPVALLWLLPLPLVDWLDHNSGSARHEPAEEAPTGPFNGILYALVAVQVLNIVLLGWLFTIQSLWSVDAIVAIVLVGGNSGISGIVVAHELTHRREARMRLLGRLLLCTVMYDHFYTEHLRGHHVRVGTNEDPATARFGEKFWPFLRRTLPGQFRSAWRLEATRLGDADMKWWDLRMLQSRVVHGLLAELTLAFGMWAVFGPAAFVLFLAQAAQAIRALEQVNYFEHWGLVRSGRKVSPCDSWDTESSFTLFALVGLSRHADHHAYASRPFQQLRHWDESPKLPTGYFAMDYLVMFRNDRFQKIMTARLRERGLGPFAES
ncbi:MAG: alkane 1-monooxygenase [Candidatus Binatia bacterium]|nr:alkane 1-monooxygenase [Candidatus Binatia bacterium]